MRILLIEDEPEAARLTAALIGAAGFNVDEALSLGDAREAMKQASYDLLLLDRRLPDGDGLLFLPIAREMRPGIRVMMLTAMDELNERVTGLDVGADDYVTKPFEEEELIARIRACLRRPGSTMPESISVGALEFDLLTRNVTVGGINAVFQRRELSLLEQLLRHINRVVSRESLLREVFLLQDDIQESALDTAVSRLRRHLNELDANVSIHTVRGVGYMLTEAIS